MYTGHNRQYSCGITPGPAASDSGGFSTLLSSAIGGGDGANDALVRVATAAAGEQVVVVNTGVGSFQSQAL